MKIYVGNLPYSVDDQKLSDLFSEFGEVSEANVIKDKFSGRSKGFGFVTFKDSESGQKAIEAMNDKEMEGRNIKVSEAKPMDPDAPRRPSRSFGGSSGGPRRFGGGSGGRSFHNRD